MNIWARRYIIALLLLAAASDFLGGGATQLFYAVATPGFLLLAGAVPLLIWALAVGVLGGVGGHRGPRSTR